MNIDESKVKIFSKKYQNRMIFLEALSNSTEAYEISKRTSVFASPAVLNFNDENLIINFEFLEDAITVLEMLRSYNYKKMPVMKLKKLFFNIGIALSEFHKHSGRLHGDFAPSNIMFKSTNIDKLFFVDFSRAVESNDPYYNRGSIYKDLSFFAIGSKIKYPYYLFPLAFRSLNDKLYQETLKGYCEDSKILFNSEEFVQEFDKHRKGFLKNTFMLKFFSWSRIGKVGWGK